MKFLIIFLLLCNLFTCNIYAEIDECLESIEKTINLYSRDSITLDAGCDDLIPYKRKLNDSLDLEFINLKNKKFVVYENKEIGYYSSNRKAYPIKRIKIGYLKNKLQFIFLKCNGKWILNDVLDFYYDYYSVITNCFKDTIYFNRAIRIIDNFIQNPDSIYNYIVSDSTDILVMNKNRDKIYITKIIKYLKDEFNTNNYEIMELYSRENPIHEYSNYSDILTIVIGNKENNKYCTFDVFISGEDYFLRKIFEKKGHRIKHYESDSDCTP